MSDLTAGGRPGAITGRRWRGPGPGRRAVVAVAIFAIAGLVTLWSWWTSWPARLVISAEGGHYPVAFSPDGATLATRSSGSGKILLWDTSSGRERSAWKVPDRPMRFSGKFSADGRTFALPWLDQSSGKDFSIDLVDVGSGRLRATCDSPLAGFLALRFRDGGRSLRLASTTSTAANGGVEVVDFDATTGRPVRSRRLGYGQNAGPGDLSPDGSLLALIGARRGTLPNLTLWDVDHDRELDRLPGPAGSADASAVEFSPDGMALAVGRDDGSIEVWDLASHRLRSTLRDRSANYPPFALAFAPDGRSLVSTGQLSRRRFSIDTITYYWLAATRPPDRAALTELVIMDVATGRRLRSSKMDFLGVFSPDGRMLATGHDDDAVRVRDVPGRP